MFENRGIGAPLFGVLLLILSGCSENSAPDDGVRASASESAPRVVQPQDMLSHADVPKLDLSNMNDAEIRKVIGPGEYCTVSYARTGRPVFAFKRAATSQQSGAVVKINGDLLAARPEATGNDVTASAGPVKIELKGLASASGNTTEARDAELMLVIGDQLRAGYQGYFKCRA